MLDLAFSMDTICAHSNVSEDAAKYHNVVLTGCMSFSLFWPVIGILGHLQVFFVFRVSDWESSQMLAFFLFEGLDQAFLSRLGSF